jgi:hypothetical protein
MDSELADIVKLFLSDDVLKPVLIFSGIVLVVGFNIISGIVKNVQRERTKREIAAFVAEGTISPGDAERLIKAGEHPKQC